MVDDAFPDLHRDFFDYFGCPACSKVYVRFNTSDGDIKEIHVPHILYATLEEKDREFCDSCERQMIIIEYLLRGIPENVFDSLQ
jgi:hypothetical protein